MQGISFQAVWDSLPRRMLFSRVSVFTEPFAMRGSPIRWFSLPLTLWGKLPQLCFCSLRGRGRVIEINQKWLQTVTGFLSWRLFSLWLLPVWPPKLLWSYNSISVMRWNWIIYNMTLMSSQFHYILLFRKAVIVYYLYNNYFNETVSMKQTVYLKKKDSIPWSGLMKQLGRRESQMLVASRETLSLVPGTWMCSVDTMN